MEIQNTLLQLRMELETEAFCCLSDKPTTLGKPMSPLTILLQFITGLMAFAFLGGGVYLVYQWQEGDLLHNGWLALGIGMLALTVLGRPLILFLLRSKNEDEPHSEHDGDAHTVKGPDGSDLYVEAHGPKGAPPVIMTHGWGLDSTAWYYEKKNLGRQFRLTLWDLPGLGRSAQPADRKYSLERLADDLRAVVDNTPDKPAVLIGHSIGGMTALTYCRLYPESVRQNIAGIILVNTTYTEPLNTIIASPVFRALKYPVIMPLMYLMIWLWPVFWAMNWLSYFNGTAHLATWVSSFSARVSRGQLDFATRFAAKMNPAVIAKGNLAMLRWDETGTLPEIDVPTLIITGSADRVTLPEASEEMLRRIPDAQLVRIQHAGHPGFIEQDDDYDEAIGDFIIACQKSPRFDKPTAADVP